MKKYNFKVSYDGGFILFAVKAANARLARLKANSFSALYFKGFSSFNVALSDWGSLPVINIHKLSGSFKGSFLWGISEREQKVMRISK